MAGFRFKPSANANLAATTDHQAMKCKKCGIPLTANTLDHCPKCDPKPAEPNFTKSGRALELTYFIIINILIILGLLYLLQLFFSAWFPHLPFLEFDSNPQAEP